MKLDEIKKLIHDIVRESLTVEAGGQVQMGRAYRLKEQLMQAVQHGIQANSDLIESQEEYEGIVDQEIQKLREDLDLTLSMIGRTLYQVPFQAFKTKNNK